MSTNAGKSNGKHDHESNEQNDTHNQTATLCTQEKLALISWGLPEKVLQYYTRKGITHMFHWQLECLTVGKVLEGGNLVYSAPTSAGKTLVAEILISQTLFERQKKAMLILPFVSVVREKMFYFQNMFSLNGIKVEGFMGGYSPSAGFKQVHMAVCTIEKANSIINRLLEEKNLNCLGLVVVDELHLLGDPYRGYLLELLLTKLKYMSSKADINIQIVGMSATLPNLKVLSNWLNADVYYSNYRPIPLSETLKCGNYIYDKKLNKLKEIIPVQSEIPDCADHIGQLCLETIEKGHSVLIFCPSKSWCESLAGEIALFFKRHAFSELAQVKDTPGWILRKELNLGKINQVVEHLKMTPVGLDCDLHRTVAYGVAFHHAGLTLDERDIIEGSFRNGSIRVLCATSTLSSGVNLPARRVIIRSPLAFGNIMDNLTYRQMIGRAGRMGVDSEGESILICKPSEKIIAQQLMASNLKPIESCLGRGTLSSSLKRALLEIVASGVASTPQEVQDYSNCTFLVSSSKHNMVNPVESCIKFLEENEFIRLQDNGTRYAPTALGLACLASSMPPDEGLSLFRELQRARRCFVLDTDLHIIYQVTPYSVSEQWSKLDWLHVLTVIENLPENMKRVGEMVGVEESFLVRIVKGTLNPNIVDNRIKLSIHRRFYTALALQDLVNEVPLTEVAEKYQCNKGTLQSLQQSAATYAGMVTEFTRRLGWGSVELIFSQFQERLQFGVQRDLCELMRLPLLNVVRARALYNAGYTNLVTVGNARASDLENILHSAVPFQTEKEIAGETKFERNQRNKLQTIWITGKAGLSVREAAELLIEQARNAVELEMGVEGAKWSNVNDDANEIDQSSHSDDFQLKAAEGQTGCQDKSDQTKEQTPDDEVSKDIFILQDDSREGNNTRILMMNASEKCRAEDSSEPKLNECTSLSVKDLWNAKDLTNAPLVSKEKQITHSPRRLETLKSTPMIPKHDNSLSEENCEHTRRNETDYFASSFNVDNILSLSEMENLNKINSDKPLDNSITKVDESDSCSTCSESSVEILFERTAISEIKKGERLSDDMFALQEVEVGGESTLKADSSRLDGSTSAEVPADLFDQSLTFDTQIQGVLDIKVDDVDVQEKPQIKRSNSFNSDDLGFVSDFSPPKLNLVTRNEGIHQMSNEPNSSFTKRISKVENLKSSNFASSPIDIKSKKEELVLELTKIQSQALKRKNCHSNSPDYIIGSDDSWTEGHKSKRARVLDGSLTGSSFLDGTKDNSGVDDSDTEIMPTPKINKTSVSSSVSNTAGISNGSLLNRKRAWLKKRNISGRRTVCNESRNHVTCSVKNMTKEKSDVSIKSNCSNLKSFEKTNEVGSIYRSLSNLSSRTNWDDINVVDVSANEAVFKSFREELKLRNIIGLALGCRRIVRERKSSIGLKIMKKKLEKPKESTPANFQFKDMILEGIAVYFNGNDVFYISFDGTGTNTTKWIGLLKEISNEKKLIRVFDAKEQIKLLHSFTSVFLEGSFQDPKTANWLLSKAWKEKGFSSVVIDHIPEATKLTSKLGPVLGFSGPGLYAKSSVLAKTRACVEAFLSYHVVERQLKLLRGKSLLKVFQEVEMPLISSLAETELVGFRFSRSKLMEIKTRLDDVQSKLSEKAYLFAQYKFSLASSVAVSKLLYNELKLGKGDHLTKKHQRPSTSKEALLEMAVETNHPLPSIILDWRKIQSVLSKVLSPLLQIDPDVSRLFSTTQVYTATGRLAMHEPNLQNMPRNFSVSILNDDSDISVREMFTPSDGCTLLSVDYCQIELRLLAHLSGDEELIKSIINSADVFVKIASRIYGVTESNVTEELRQNAKKTCYGIIYGIGARSLAHELRVEEGVAMALMDDFKTKYKGVSKYLDIILRECRKKGYVSSLLGRRRYLSYINDPNPAIRSEAERQAINTTIQGSAADILKMAMVKIREKLQVLKEGNVTVNLLLHLHDELLFEVTCDYIETVAVTLRETMECVVPLKVPTPVKFHVGPSWGQLRLYEF